MNQNQTADFHIEELFNSTIQNVLFLIFGLICIIAVYMNLTIIYLYNTNKIQCSNFNLCLVHLSGMNIAQSIGLLPYVYVDQSTLENQSTYVDGFKCGMTEGLCGFFAFSFGCVWCISFMSISRLAIIRKPLSGHMRKRKVRTVLIILWIIGILGVVPNMFSWKLDTIHGYCLRVHLFTPISGLIYQLVLFIVGLALPLFIQTATYIMIIYQLYKKKSMNVNNASVRYRKHVIVLLGVLICINILCWTPFGIYWIMSSFYFFGRGAAAVYRKERIVRYVMIPCASAGVFNPICYALTGTEFREGLKKIYPLKAFLSFKRNRTITRSSSIQLSSSRV